MKNLFTILPFVVNNPALVKIPVSDVEQLVTNYEIGAYDLWSFAASSSSLTGKMYSNILTPQTTPPTYSENSLTILSDLTKSLQTPLIDNGDSYTICGIFNIGSLTVAPTMIIGTINSTNGFGMFVQDNGVVRINHRGALPTSTIVGNVSASTWMFLAISINNTGPTKQVTIKIGNNVPTTVPLPGTYSPSNANISIGSSRLTGSASGINIHVSELVLFNKALSADELNNLHDRAVLRTQIKGISI